MPSRAQQVRPTAPVTSTRGALLALALGSFAIGCTEFVAVGLLPQIATDLHHSEGAVGQLVTLNAVAVALGAPLLGAALNRWSPRAVLVVTLLVFAAAHLMAAAAPGFSVLLASRVVTGAAFGAYLAIAFALAARLADDEARGRALGTVQAGITTATALGVPFGMLLGEVAGGTGGWRVPFVGIAVLSGLAAGAVRLAVPRTAPVRAVSVRARLGVLARRPVAAGIATVAVFWAGSFCAFTYLVPLLRGSTGLAGGAATAVLLLAGAMSVAGNVVGARCADRAPSRTLLLSALGTLLGIVALHLGAAITPVAVVAVGIWQLAAWSFVPAIQAKVFELAEPDGEAALSFAVSAFNVGIVAGAGVGGVALDTGGSPAVGVVAALAAAVALAMTAGLTRRRWVRAGHT